MFKMQRLKAILLIILIFATCSIVQGCDKTTNTGKGANIPMKTYYIGRFSLAVPAEMKREELTSEIRHVKIGEILWPVDVGHEQARYAEWDKFMAMIKKLPSPDGTDKVIIRVHDFPGVGQWAKGAFYHNEGDAADEGTWSLLLDTGTVGVLFKGRSVLVEKENQSHLMLNNLNNLCESYHSSDTKASKPLENSFYLQYGMINLPYSWQEESYASFKGHPLNLNLTIKMQMDIGHFRETMGLIEGTKGMIDDASREPGISFSIVRLGKREVAGMKGEESILRASDNGKKSLLFAWEFNGKEDSGEYPTTTIEMEASDGKLDEKTRVWDAVLDSMKPMFERKK